MARHEVPDVQISDNGPQFSAEEFTHLQTSKGLSIKLISIPYFP